MKKLFALLLAVAMVASLFTGIAFAAGTYTVAFKPGASTEAGANSTLVFTFTDDTASNIVIDFGNSGFVPIGAAIWANGTDVTSNIVGNVITINRSNAVSAAVVEIPVRNPLTAKVVDQAVPADAFTVTTGGTPTTSSSKLNVNYTVTPSITTAVAGTTATITVNITEAGVLANHAVNYVVKRGAAVITSGTTNNGTFSSVISFSVDAGAFSQNYTVEVQKASDATVTGLATIVTKYGLNVEGVANLKYLGSTTITGTLVDAAGKGIAGAAVTLTNKVSGTTLAANTTAANGAFAMTAVFNDAAKYAINVGGVEYNTFTVGGLDLAVATTPTSVINTLGTTALTISVKHGNTAVDAQAWTRILKPDGTVLAGYDWAQNRTSISAAALNALAAGTYKIEARWENDSVCTDTNDVWDRTGFTTFVVNNPSKLNTSFTWGVGDLDADGKVLVGNRNITVGLVDIANAGLQASPTASQIKKVVFTVSGPLKASKTFDSSATGATFDDAGKTLKTINIDVEQGGTITVAGTVTFGDNSTVEFSKTFTTNGWVVTTEKVVGTVGDVVTLRAVVTTVNGTPVNNAIVTWSATTPGVIGAMLTAKDSEGKWITPSNSVSVDSRVTMINNGIYEKEVKLDKATDLSVTVTTVAPADRAIFQGSIKGQEYFTITPSVNSVIATLAGQTLRVTITDPNGNKVTNLQSLDVSNQSGGGVSLTIANATMFDANSDGIVDGYQFSVSPNTTGTITITAKAEGGNKIGTATVAVVAPNVTVNLGNKITENVAEKLNVKVNDMTGNPAVARTIQLRVTAVGANMKLDRDASPVVNLTDGTAPNQTATEAASAEHKLTVLAWDFDESPAAAVAPLVRLEGSYGTGWVKLADLAVTPLNIELNSDSIYVGGVNKVEVTVTDAHGVAYANKAVTLAGSTGTTDAAGKVTLYINPSSTGTATLTVATSRAGVTTDKKINITSDNVKPTLAITSAAKSEKASYVLTGTFSDNLGVTTIYVNGAPIPFIAALGEFEYNVTLTQGNNTFTVFAFDAAGNGAKETFVVNYAPVAPVVITLGKANPAIGLDVPAEVKNGRTMVPFRWFGEKILGATVDYVEVGSVGIVTLVKDGKTVELTLNSTIAKVDGNAVALDVAPYVNSGRTLVPARFLSEVFGYSITWDSATNNVTITK